MLTFTVHVCVLLLKRTSACWSIPTCVQVMIVTPVYFTEQASSDEDEWSDCQEEVTQELFVEDKTALVRLMICIVVIVLLILKIAYPQWSRALRLSPGSLGYCYFVILRRERQQL